MIVLGRRIQMEQRMAVPKSAVVIVPVVSVIAALVVGGVFLALTGHPPVRTYLDLLDNGYTSFYGITDTLGLATPLICTGLAAAFAFRMNLWRIGRRGVDCSARVFARAAWHERNCQHVAAQLCGAQLGELFHLWVARVFS